MTEENVQEEVVPEESGAQKAERENAELFYEPEKQVEDGDKPKDSEASDSEAVKKDKEESILDKKEGEEIKKNEEKEEEDSEESDESEASEKIDLKELKIPDEEYISTEDVERIAKQVEERGLSKEVAQMLIDERSGALSGLAEAYNSHIQEERTAWKQSAISDKEIGGENLDQTVRRANLFLDKLGTPELREMIESDGYGNHPEVLRILSRAGAIIENDTSVIGGKGPTTNTRSVEDIFYPSMKQ